MTVLYRALVANVDEARRLLSRLESSVKEQAELGMHADHDALTGSLSLLRGDAHAVIVPRALSNPEKAALAFLGPLGGTLEFLPHGQYPEAVGLCWEALVLLSVVSPTAVWLNASTYGSNSLNGRKHHAVQLADGEYGHALSAEDFRAFVESALF